MTAPDDLPPLAELHCHIEGAIAPELARAQARKYNVDLGDVLDGNGYVWSDFTTFLHAYAKIAALFRTAEDYALLAETYLRELAGQGCIYSEMFLAPVPPYVPTLAPEAYLEGVLEGARRAEAATGIVARFIIVGIRHEGAEAVEAAADFAIRHRSDRLTGFGMAGEERMHHPRDFVRAFDRARDGGLRITVHAGELAGPESVAAALDHIKPERIGHGVRAIEDPALVERLARSGVVLECCPGSNVALGLYGSYRDHPLIALRDAGVKVTISSDDPPFFHTDLRQDHLGIRKAFGLDRAAMADFTRTAIKAAFADEATKARLLARLDEKTVAERN